MSKVSKSVSAKATAALHAVMAEEKGDRIQVPGGVFAHDGAWYPAGNGLWATAAGQYRGIVDGVMVCLWLVGDDDDSSLRLGLIGPDIKGRLCDPQTFWAGCHADKGVNGNRAKILAAVCQRGEEYGMPNLYAAVKAIFKHWKTVGSVEDPHPPVQ
jgi:hypothetical protein